MGAGDTADLSVANVRLGWNKLELVVAQQHELGPKRLGSLCCCATGWPVGLIFSRSGVFDVDYALGDCARLGHPGKGLFLRECEVIKSLAFGLSIPRG
jgi:hypothetical protein